VSKPRDNKAELGGNKSEPKSINRQQEVFVQEYLKDLNGTQAAIRAGYSAATARQIGSRLLRDPRIAAAVDDARKVHLAKLQADSGISLERTLKEIARLAFFDPRKLFDADGKPIPINLLDDDTAAAIAGLKVATKGNAEMGFGEVTEYKVSEKKGALDMLMKNLGGYEADKDKPPPDGATSIPLNELARRIAFAMHQGLKAQQGGSA
jgi:phage terminase small subunit